MDYLRLKKDGSVKDKFVVGRLRSAEIVVVGIPHGENMGFCPQGQLDPGGDRNVLIARRQGSRARAVGTRIIVGTVEVQIEEEIGAEKAWEKV